MNPDSNAHTCALSDFARGDGRHIDNHGFLEHVCYLKVRFPTIIFH